MSSGGEDDRELSPGDLLVLFVAVARALAFDELRFKPREKQFALLLASESFGEGSACGWIDIEAWRLRLPVWRSNELRKMFESWRRAGYVAVDVTENTFRLAPDQFPGWANVQAIQRSERRQHALNLMTEDDLHKIFAKISQQAALNAAKISQVVTKISQPAAPAGSFAANFSQPGEPTEGNVKTFNRSTSERINVKRCGEPPLANCENFATEAVSRERAEALKGCVREFVGEQDWTSREFWNCGVGWRGRLFLEEYSLMEGALAYCRAALKDRNSEVTIRKTRGAMLWDQFQRLRREAMREAK
jgi:hypothetical protein